MSSAKSPGGRIAQARRNDTLLLQAARRVIAQKGAEASVAEIATEAGMGVASLYRRYATKEDLISSLVHDSIVDFIEAAESALSRPESEAADALVEFIGSAVEHRTGVFERAAASFEGTDELIELARSARSMLNEILDRAKRSGAIRQDVEATDIRDLISLFSNHPGGPKDRVLQLTIAGLFPANIQVLPSMGESPSWIEQIENSQINP